MSGRRGNILDEVNSPQDLKKLPMELLPILAEEIRELIIDVVSKNGGHLATNLGFVETTVALHYVLNSPKDKIVWDVGHQAYAHKILTGRKDRIHTIRKTGGLSGFPNKAESPHDHFNVGHASTSISQALGLAVARDMNGGNEKIVAVCGDGALTGGLAYEGLNNVGHIKVPMTVILNDNKMAISKSTGAMSRYLNKIITTPIYNRIREEIEKKLKHFPALKNFLKHTEESLKNFLVPGIVFEELGLRYFGPINGHDIPLLIHTLKNVLMINEPTLIHVVTVKGKGYRYAESSSHIFHSAPPFNVETGELKKNKENVSFSSAFSRAMEKIAGDDSDIVAITAAMRDGAGLSGFSKLYPDRFFDVGIAEGHAVCFAGALASSGKKPVCAIYSTFLQRAYDQLIHDVALQGVGVTFCLDRAGVVGADGPTHHGLFDFAYMKSVPGSVVAAPADGNELLRMLELGVNYKGVFSIRYPKADTEYGEETSNFNIGEGRIIAEGEDILILAVGSMVDIGMQAVSLLKDRGVSAGLYDMRFVKPLDRELILSGIKKYSVLMTLEEHIESGGFGASILEFLNGEGIAGTDMIVKAFPNYFIEQGDREYLFDKYGLSPLKIANEVCEKLNLK